MRKVLCFLFFLIFMLSAAACTASSGDPSLSTPGDTAPPATSGNAEDAPLHTLYAISVPSEVETLSADNGTVLFEYAYQHIQVHLPDQNVSDKITLDFLTRVDSTRENATAISLQAQEAFINSTNWSPISNLLQPYPC